MATRASSRPSIPSIHSNPSSNMVNGKRKSMSTNKVIEEDEPDKKKRKPATKKQPAFKPQPVPITNSSDTPPDNDDEDLHLLPPPSERKIARRRDSTREFRERQESPTPNNTNLHQSSSKTSSSTSSSKRIKTSSSSSGNNKQNARSRSKSVDPIRAAINTSDDPLGGIEETESMRTTNSNTKSNSTTGAAIAVEGLFIQNSKPMKSSAPRPSSPPRRTFSSSSSSSHPTKMGPPQGMTSTSGGFVRKTRQSMGREKGRIAELSQESLVPLVQSETPIIRKNQELRGQQARRSSLDHRGGRASSSWGRGEITMPHKNVGHKLFYRHIPVSYPEPIKARMLLVWCANRALEDSLRTSSSSSSRRDKGKGKAKEDEIRTDEGDKMLKEIMDEFVRDMNRGGVDTSVFGAPGQETTIAGLKPHPKNVANRKVEAAANADIRKYKGEGAQWGAIISAINAKQEEVKEQTRKKKAAYKIPNMSTAEDWMKNALSLAEGIISQGDGELEDKGEFDDVEFKIDSLHQTSHMALQYVLQSSRFLDGIFSSLSSDLRMRDRMGSSSSSSVIPGKVNDEEGFDTISLLSATRQNSSSASTTLINPPSTSDPMNLLRALSSKESISSSYRNNNNNENLNLIEKAMQIPPVVITSSSQTATTSATPRRQNHLMSSSTSSGSSNNNNTTTPRRQTGLTSQTPRSRRGLTPGGSKE